MAQLKFADTDGDALTITSYPSAKTPHFLVKVEAGDETLMMEMSPGQAQWVIQYLATELLRMAPRE